MSDIVSSGFVRHESGPVLPAPVFSRGPLAWLRSNLFYSIPSTILTLIALYFVARYVPALIKFMTVDAVWTAQDGAPCRLENVGACWAFVGQKLPFFTYGFYPELERWRVNVTFILCVVLIAWLLWPTAPRKNVAAALFFVAFPILAFVLLRGGLGSGLVIVGTNLWGGMMVSMIVALVGIVFSLPLGILLALGRRSTLPIVKTFCVGFIEIVRGVPFITVLFMAQFLLPLLLPDPTWSDSFDHLLRVLIGTALFSAAYMAEEVRGGLQAMPKGQYEGAMAMGLGYWQMMRLIILPQALTLVIPGIVNNFIGLFKDTTLVAVVGIFDFLATVDAQIKDPIWTGPFISSTGYLFAGMFFFVFCYGMSRYSQGIERKLAKSKNH